MTNQRDEAIQICRQSALTHGRTYSLAARLLPRPQREAVWCLYAWARLVDDVVDFPEGDVGKRVQEIHDLLKNYLQGFTLLPDASDHHIISAATADTIRTWGIDETYLDDFIRSMLTDVPGTAGHIAWFRTWDELDDYMWGSAAVIGLQVLPLLPVRGDRKIAAAHAAELGRAFQVTNFIRDLREDMQRGRMYLPMETWEAFGVDEGELKRCLDLGASSPRVRAAISHFVAVNRSMYRLADPGTDMLRGPARHSIRAARVLYAAILDDIETGRTDPFTSRSVVPNLRRLRLVLPHALAAAITAPLPARDDEPRGQGGRATRRSGGPARTHPQ